MSVKPAAAHPVYGEFGSHEFDASYEAAKSQVLDAKSPGEARTVKGSVHNLCILYYQSAEFRALQATTQKNYRRQIETFRSKVGDVMVRSITRQHIFKIRDAYADKPGAGRTLLKRLNTLFNFALDRGFRPDNPMLRVKLPKEGPGFLPWSDQDITTFLKHWDQDRANVWPCTFASTLGSDDLTSSRWATSTSKTA